MNWDQHFTIFGLDLSAVQAKLNQLGASPPLTVDGISGPKTQAAIIAFQSSHGLTPDGVVGPLTEAALGLTDAPPKAPVGSSGSTVGLKPAVIASLPSIFGKWEGLGLPYMYTDKKGYVTTGTGNLIDPVESALLLPWMHPDGSPLSADEITADWNTVKSAWPGTRGTASQSLTTSRLTKQALSDLVNRTVKGFYNTLRGMYPGIDTWPADAQLAMLSQAWAWGPGFANVWGTNGQRFKAAVNQAKPDFVTAANIMRQANAHEESINPGIIPRNIGTQAMFNNAANILNGKQGFDTLFYPSIAPITKAVGGGLLALGAAGIGGLLWWQSQKRG